MYLLFFIPTSVPSATSSLNFFGYNCFFCHKDTKKKRHTVIFDIFSYLCTMKLQWHVVHVASRTEKKVAERLEKKEVAVYLPLQKKLRQWSDRKKWVETVVLSGYVFVKINKSKHLDVLQTPGVSRFLKHNYVPVCISDSEMQEFQNFIEKAENHPIEFTAEKPPVGTQIIIQAGNFKGCFGEVIEHKGKRKITVAVNLEKIGHFFITLSPTDVLVQS